MSIESSQAAYTIYVDGIFDIPHTGHRSMLKKAYREGVKRAQADPRFSKVRLLVGVCNEGVAEYKREPIMNALERAESVRNLLRDQLEAEVFFDGVPIKVSKDFLEEHKINLVVHGDDFSEEDLQKYYGAAMEAAEFTTVPYSKGISTSEILVKAKTKGKLGMDGDHLAVNPDEIVKRIRSRTWRQLRIDNPSLYGRLQRADFDALEANFLQAKETEKNPTWVNVALLSWRSFRSATVSAAFLASDLSTRAFYSIKNWRNEMGNGQLIGARLTELVRDVAGSFLSFPVACVSPKTAIDVFHVKSETYMDRCLTPERAAKLYAIGYGVLGFMERHDIDYAPSSGTTLGLVRSGGIIPWDDDMDLFIHPDSCESLRELVEDGTFELETGLSIYWQPKTGGFQAYFADGEDGPDILGPVKLPFVDLFFSDYDKEGRITYQSSIMGGLASDEYYTVHEWAESKVYDFGPLKMKGPANLGPYFERSFGEDAMKFAYQTLHHFDFKVKKWPQRVVIDENKPLEYDKELFESLKTQMDESLETANTVVA